LIRKCILFFDVFYTVENTVESMSCCDSG